jgi:hypothetical protein
VVHGEQQSARTGRMIAKMILRISLHAVHQHDQHSLLGIIIKGNSVPQSSTQPELSTH